jgi:hypothetical protein
MEPSHDGTVTKLGRTSEDPVPPGGITASPRLP